MLLSFIALVPLSSLQSVTLFRGAEVPSVSTTRYFACSDTSLLKALPNSSDGLGAFLKVGKETRALIRFGDLRFVFGTHAKILSARLILNGVTLTPGKAVSLRRVKVPWTEGAGTGNDVSADDSMKTTWSHRITFPNGQSIKWDGGASDASATVSSTATPNSQDGALEFESLEHDLQDMVDNPGSNFGWMIESEGEQLFDSSESVNARPRLVVEFQKQAPKSGPDLLITGVGKQRPDTGTLQLEITIVNQGVTASQSFDCTVSRWGSELAKVTIGAGLQVGDAATQRIIIPLKAVPSDPRVNSLSVSVQCEGDVCTANNQMDYFPDGQDFTVRAERGFLAKCAASGINFQEYCLQLFDTWNQTFFAFSRFSIARDGCPMRANLSRTEIEDDGNLARTDHLQELKFSAANTVPSTMTAYADIRSMTQQLGIADGTGVLFRDDLPPKGWDRPIEFEKSHFGTDPFAGIMGSGDTRNETLIPGQLPIPIGPTDEVVFASGLFEPTGLYSLSDVAQFQSRLNPKTESVGSLPKVVLIRATDMNGVPIPEGALRLYRIQNGAPLETPAATCKVAGDSAMLTNLTTSAGGEEALFPPGVPPSSVSFLVELECFGQHEWSFLKGWQLSDAAARGNKSAYVHEMRFNVTLAPLKPGNWALNKVAIDAKNSPPSEIMKWLDGDRNTSYACDQDWIEIDLGRDKPIGEVRIYSDPAAANRFWSRFEVIGYSTGQTVADAQKLVVENHPELRPLYCFEPNRSDWCLMYRFRPRTVRFVRFVRLSKDASMLREIEIRETQPLR